MNRITSVTIIALGVVGVALLGYIALTPSSYPDTQTVIIATHRPTPCPGPGGYAPIGGCK